MLTIPVAALGLLFAIALAKEILVSRPLPAPPPLRASQISLTSGGTPVPDDSPVAELTVYGMISSRSLFSPGRSETSTAASAKPAGRPVLHGVVLDGPKSRAYLEDPLVKGVFGYIVGKPVGPGQIKAISADRVLITGPEGTFEVLLNDEIDMRAIRTCFGADVVNGCDIRVVEGRGGPRFTLEASKTFWN